MKAVSEFTELLIELAEIQDVDFSGIGLILYSSLDNLDFILMKDNAILSNKLIRGKVELLKFIKEISCHNNYFHDGFHLINEKLELTHLSAFISPKINNDLIVFDGYGSRYRTAIYSSLCPGILATGVIGKSYGPFVFQNGNTYNVGI